MTITYSRIGKYIELFLFWALKKKTTNRTFRFYNNNVHNENCFLLISYKIVFKTHFDWHCKYYIFNIIEMLPLHKSRVIISPMVKFVCNVFILLVATLKTSTLLKKWKATKKNAHKQGNDEKSSSRHGFWRNK